MTTTIWLPYAGLLLALLPATIISALANNHTCEDGHFGPDCQFLCHCGAGHCDLTTGQCPGPCAEGWSGLACQFGNVALNKRVRVSNEWHGNVDTTVDGRRRKSLTHYERSIRCLGVAGRQIPGGEVAFWEVDLGSQHVVYNLSIWHSLYTRRGHSSPSYRDPRATLVVRVVNESITDDNLLGPSQDEWNYSICNVRSNFRLRVSHIKEVMLPCTKPLVGRFVILEAYYNTTRSRNNNTAFTLCEVDVFGYEDCAGEGSSGPACQNECRCRDPQECGIYGDCHSGCRNLDYGRYCQYTRKVPKLAKIEIETAIDFSDFVMFSATNLGSSRRYYFVPSDNTTYNNSIAGKFKFFYQFQKNDNGSWQSLPANYSISSISVYLPLRLNRKTMFRLRIVKLPEINGSFDHLDFINMNDKYVDGNVVAVSNTLTICSASEVGNLEVRAGSTAAMVTWDSPKTEPDCQVYRYKIETDYQLLNPCKVVELDFRYRTYNRNYTNSTSVILKSLNPFANYTIKVSPIANGTVGHSRPMFFSTLSAVPKHEVEKSRLDVRNVTATSAELYRRGNFDDDAAVFDCRGLNGRFKLYTIKLADLTWDKYDKTFNLTNPDQEYYNMTGLRPYTQYNLTYAIVNDVAESPFVNGTIFRTEARRPEKPVLSLTSSLRVQLIGAPTARLTEIVVECNKTMFNNQTKTLKLIRNIERTQLLQIYTFSVLSDVEMDATSFSRYVEDGYLSREDQTVFKNRPDEAESVVQIECRVTVNSDEGPSDWATTDRVLLGDSE